MEQFIFRQIKKYVKNHFPSDYKKICKRQKEIFPAMMANAPDLGGKENSLAGNLTMFIIFLSFYEATNHRLDGNAIDELLIEVYNSVRFLSPLMNINHKSVLNPLRKYLYKSYKKYADDVKKNQAEGKWIDTWGMLVNPNNTEEGFAFTLVGCPLVQYAKKYGYMELMPHMCKLDHQYAKLMHAKLIRTHTVATGADSCDYWYVPDKSETAINYNGVII
ncbi:MAG: L-2-amino-thiazoline-4-carboxylic acid hydrolase [Treponemataceae bacterium]|nr:L-2-amino-thiazoline-4-carboxylic acid hydrolase [Treponemataceae bacterium]